MGGKTLTPPKVYTKYENNPFKIVVCSGGGGGDGSGGIWDQNQSIPTSLSINLMAQSY
jgi:hypothetical protein